MSHENGSQEAAGNQNENSFNVSRKKIDIISGPGGRMIKKIIAGTGAKINISDDGTVTVSGEDISSVRRAEEWIKILAGDIKVDTEFEGIVRRVVDFGLFVELVPGKDGLVHISTIDRDKQESLESDYPEGTPLRVKVASFDPERGRVGLIAPELQA